MAGARRLADKLSWGCPHTHADVGRLHNDAVAVASASACSRQERKMR